jgi:hypothetical protein
MRDDYRESTFTRHRRGILLAGPFVGVAALVGLYDATKPRPTTGIVAQAGDLPTLSVGALPVT